MPIYKYHCDNCNHEMEQFLRTDKDSVPIACKRCARMTIAEQQRDNEVEYKETGYVQGTVKHDEAGA